MNNYDTRKTTSLSGEAIKELKWWHKHILNSSNRIRSSIYDLEIFSDASLTGWGSTCGNQEAHGLWNASERNMHINYLEIKAAFLALKCFASSAYDIQILLRIDNITALAYINKMGGTQHRSLNELTKELWEWCIERKIWIFAEYVASNENLAYEGSRINNIDTEWELSGYAYNTLCKEFGNPSIDLFATRINRKCERYCSWERDPDALSINSLTISWKDEFWYAFPPFSLILKVLKKIKEEGSTGILIVPLWSIQPWYPEFKHLPISKMVTFKPSTKLLLSPCRKVTHPLASSLTLVGGVISGSRCRKRTYTMIQ